MRKDAEYCRKRAATVLTIRDVCCFHSKSGETWCVMNRIAQQWLGLAGELEEGARHADEWDREVETYLMLIGIDNPDSVTGFKR
jgi:hypothetical protein